MEAQRVPDLFGEIGLLYLARTDVHRQRQKRQIWRRLCDETHGGLQQVLSRVSPNEIGRRFSSEEAIRYLMASTSASYLAGIGLAAVLADERLTLQLRKTFHNIFADDMAE